MRKYFNNNKVKIIFLFNQLSTKSLKNPIKKKR
jgi:hypothetical protein